jgi:hypothetical protein
MRWQFWRQPTPKKLSAVVLKTLLSQFVLDPLLVDRIRYLSRNGRFSGRRSQYIRIFDPSLIGELVTVGAAFDDFSDNQDHRGALLFEGRTEKIDENVQVYLTDRRVV